MAGSRVRRMRKRVHEAFDPIWRTGGISRDDAYELLAKTMGIPRDECHISWFLEDRCDAALAAIRFIQNGDHHAKKDTTE